ncbi:hypothetical protein [Spirosoma koreense]
MKSIIDTLDHPDWKIDGWQIKFMLSERLLHTIKKRSEIDNWYEDPAVTAVWMKKLRICFTSMQIFHQYFNVLPHVGDRLFDEDSGMIVQERSIDGNVMTITFTVSQ